MPRYDDVEIGTELPTQSFPIQRANLVQYAGASGDFNIIHWNERVAKAVGLPNVIAHGMLTMATAGRVVTDWVGDPGALVSYGVRFSRPVVVEDDDQGATLTVSGVVEDKRPADGAGGEVVVALTARVGEDKVLAGAKAVVRLP
ncbi:MAG: MaoC/PaaZ C-terminal domain-containing protein [Mycobacteriales bacterium]|nr:MaoC/PaaZ C-terminal domain-containing protein [Mycobacteriales bacterium]